MIRNFKKGLACALVAALTLATAAPVAAADAVKSPVKAPEATAAKDVTSTTVVKGVDAKVNTGKSGVATLASVEKTDKTSISVAATVTVKGVEYKVTTVAPNAFADCAKATKITLPTTIKAVKANAFTGAKKVKMIVLKSNGKVSVNKSAFKGLSTKKMTIKINKKMSKANYNRLVKQLRKAGFKGKIKRTIYSY